MRSVVTFFALVILAACVSRAQGALVVTSHRTVAQTNGYAPTNHSQYFAEQQLENVSPALAEASGDWTGPNADGTPNTWHFVGHSRASSVTTITPDSYRVEAAASFAYTFDTTADFVDPLLSTLVFGPSGTANYRGFFETDVPMPFSVSAQLNDRSRIRLDSFAGSVVFNEGSSSSGMRIVNLAGTIPAGRYQFLATTGIGVGNQSSGIHHIERSGGFENLVFTARVPEPSVFEMVPFISAFIVGMRRGARRDPP